MKKPLQLLLIFLVPLIFLKAGTTGKLTGQVTDEVTGEPLPFVNITVEGTMLGAATDLDGKYVILNLFLHSQIQAFFWFKSNELF